MYHLGPTDELEQSNRSVPQLNSRGVQLNWSEWSLATEEESKGCMEQSNIREYLVKLLNRHEGLMEMEMEQSKCHQVEQPNRRDSNRSVQNIKYSWGTVESVEWVGIDGRVQSVCCWHSVKLACWIGRDDGTVQLVERDEGLDEGLNQGNDYPDDEEGFVTFSKCATHSLNEDGPLAKYDGLMPKPADLSPTTDTDVVNPYTPLQVGCTSSNSDVSFDPLSSKEMVENRLSRSSTDHAAPDFLDYNRSYMASRIQKQRKTNPSIDQNHWGLPSPTIGFRFMTMIKVWPLIVIS
jgi:hypothetical protein